MYLVTLQAITEQRAIFFLQSFHCMFIYLLQHLLIRTFTLINHRHHLPFIQLSVYALSHFAVYQFIHTITHSHTCSFTHLIFKNFNSVILSHHLHPFYIFSISFVPSLSHSLMYAFAPYLSQ